MATGERTGPVSDGEAIGILASFLAFLAIVALILREIAERLQSGDVLAWIKSVLDPYLFILYTFAFLICGLLVAAMVYMRGQIELILDQERTQLYPGGSMESAPLLGEETEPKNPKWERIENHIDSESPGDWRVAILEADIMLDEILESMSYHGETIGEKLKKVEKSDFTTLDKAWEAHKVRNQIAHEGSNFALSAREARRVIDLYREVFEEFQYI